MYYRWTGSRLWHRTGRCVSKSDARPRPIRFWTQGIESKPENAIHCIPIARFLATRYRKYRSAALGCNMF